MNNCKVILAFNKKQKDTLQEIIKGLSENIYNKKYKVGYFTIKGDELEVVEWEKEHHHYLNYYWCEYQKGDGMYRITMFYKDFDSGSGNIHVLPGAIQLWERMKGCEDKKLSFCEKELRQCNRDKYGNLNYKMKGGSPYCEYEWKPFFSKPIFWNKDNLKTVIDNINKDCPLYTDTGINSNTFYDDVKKYSSCWNWPPKVQRKWPRKYISRGHQSTQYLATETHK